MLFSGTEPQSQKPKRPDAKTQDAESQRMSSQLVILFALFSNSSRTTYATAFTFSVHGSEVLPREQSLSIPRQHCREHLKRVVNRAVRGFQLRI